jgi:hypothetical protein
MIDIQFHPTQDDGSGHVRLTAELPEDRVKLLREFNATLLDTNPRVFAETLLSEEPYVIDTRDLSTKGPLYYLPCTGEVPWKYVEPYVQHLRKHTGYAGPIPEIDLLPAVLCRLVSFQFYRSLTLKNQPDGTVTAPYDVLHRVYRLTDPNTDVPDYTRRQAQRRTEEVFAETQHEPEYIETRSGQFTRNPNYASGRIKPLVVGRKNDRVTKLLFEAWRKYGASEAQKELLEKVLGTFPTQYGSIYVEDPEGTIQWSETKKASIIPCEEFVALAATQRVHL